MSWMDVKEAMRFSPKNADELPPRKFHGDAGVVDPGGLTRDQRLILGFVLRLDIPLDESRNLRRYAEQLRGLAERLDFLSRRTDLGEFDILQEAKLAAYNVRQHFLAIYPTKTRILPPK